MRSQLMIGNVFFAFLSFIFLFGLSFVYLIYANSTATLGYEVKSLEQKKQELTTKNSLLKMQVSDYESLESLQNRNVVQDMPKAKDPHYIQNHKQSFAFH